MLPSRTAERNEERVTIGTPLHCIPTKREVSRLCTVCWTESCRFSKCRSSGDQITRRALGLRVTTCSLQMVSRVPSSLSKIGLSLIYHADPMYFPGRAAHIYYRRSAEAKEGQDKQDTSGVEPLPGQRDMSSPLDTVAKAIRSVLPGGEDKGSKTQQDLLIGSLGILHPTVLQNYSIVNPCSSLEINIEPFL
jgi:hypothetical protein